MDGWSQNERAQPMDTTTRFRPCLRMRGNRGTGGNSFLLSGQLDERGMGHLFQTFLFFTKNKPLPAFPVFRFGSKPLLNVTFFIGL